VFLKWTGNALRASGGSTGKVTVSGLGPFLTTPWRFAHTASARILYLYKITLWTCNPSLHIVSLPALAGTERLLKVSREMDVEERDQLQHMLILAETRKIEAEIEKLKAEQELMKIKSVCRPILMVCAAVVLATWVWSMRG